MYLSICPQKQTNKKKKQVWFIVCKGFTICHGMTIFLISLSVKYSPESLVNDLFFKISEGSENAEPYTQDVVRFPQRYSKQQQILNMNELELESVWYFYFDNYLNYLKFSNG